MMTAKLLTLTTYLRRWRRKTQPERLDEDQAWDRVRGMWKDKDSIDPVGYQRKLRDEADHVEV